MSKQRKLTQYWISPKGGVGVWSEVYGDRGERVSTSGLKPPKGARKVYVEDLVKHFAEELAEEKRAFETKQSQASVQSEVQIERRALQVAELVDAGISEVTAEAIVPQAIPHSPRPYSPPPNFEQHLKNSYGFTDDDVASVMSALDD